MVLGCPQFAAADTWVVDADGGGDFTTIDEAVDAASPGDSILIRSGTYEGQVFVTSDKDGLVLIGDGPAGTVVIDDEMFCFGIAGMETPCRLENLVMQGAVEEFSALTIFGSRAEIIDCVFCDNVGPGGCLGVGGGFQVKDGSDVSIEGCLFENNTDWDAPGGLIIWDSRADIIDCVFRNNEACYGGGLEFYHCGGFYSQGFAPSVVSHSVFVQNYSNHLGGAIFSLDSSPIIRSNTFVGNGGLEQCAIRLLEGAPEIDANVFVGSPIAVDCRPWDVYAASAPLLGRNLAWETNADYVLDCGEPGDWILADPLFCEEETGNYEVCADSPCVTGGEPLGALGAGCPPCMTSTEAMSWGELKALYR